MLKDSEGKPLSFQQITSMTFVSTKPPKYDCEIFSESQNKVVSEEDTNSFDENFLLFVTYFYLSYRDFQKARLYSSTL